ncbi:MAG: hypothetical protein ACT4NV_20020 [Rhodoferax sp.]
MESLQAQIAHAAARMVADEGLDYGAAKQRALRQLGLSARTPLPGNLEVEDAVREHLALFCADTQPQELAALRTLALRWMRQLQAFAPQISGAVWRGTATRLNDIHLQLYTDDGKGVEWWLIDQGLRYQAQGNEDLVLSLSVACPDLRCHVGLHLHVQPPSQRHGSRSPDARALAREGSLAELERLVDAPAHALEPRP